MKQQINFELFHSTVDATIKPFVFELHSYLMENSCNASYYERKSGYVVRYQYGEPLRDFIFFSFKKQGLFINIRGEHNEKYSDFLDTLPVEMIKQIEKASVCHRIVSNGCSPVCIGYDFYIGDVHYQKCVNSCFNFLITDISKPYIKSFVEHELSQRDGSGRVMR